MLKLRENGLNIDYMYETNSVLRKTAETEISDLTFWLRFGSIRVFINRNRTEIRFPHIPTRHPYKINVRIEYKRLSLTHEALTTAQLGYLSAQPDLCSAPSCSCYSFCCHPLDHLHILLLRITNRSFRYAPPHLWNQLPVSFRQQLYKTPS